MSHGGGRQDSDHDHGHDRHHDHDHDHDHDHHDHHDHDHGHDHDHDHGHGHGHDHHHGHDHDHSHGIFSAHDHSEELRNASKRDLTIALVIIASFMFVEVIGGILSGSLALIADAGHMLTDAASIGLALFAVHFATRAASVERTFGYHRLEILAALTNALTLWLISAWVIFEAYHRFQAIPEVEGGLMLIIGVLGLLANLAAAWVLHRSAKHSVNVEGALAHVIADILGSVAVIVSGVLVWAFEWYISDPILSVLIGILILLSTWRLLAKVVHVLLEGTPDHVDVYNLCHQIEDLEGVTVIHDVHVWTLAPGYDALTAHVLVDPEREGDSAKLLHEIQEIAYNKFNIQHITVQVESTATHCNEDHHVDHLVATARPH